MRLLGAVAVLLGGCATEAVMNMSAPKPERLAAASVALKLESASVLRQTVALPGTDARPHLVLCLTRTRLPDGVPESFLVKLPEPYPFTDAPLDMHPALRKDGDSLVLSLDGRRDVSPGCGARPGETLAERLPIIEVAAGEDVALPAGVTDAVVFSTVVGSGLGVSYLSAAPVFGGHHSVAVDLSRGEVDIGARPYLLLLLPAAVVADVAMWTAILALEGANAGSVPTYHRR